MKIMKERRDYIKNSIESADNKLKEAEKARDEYLEDLKHVEDYKKGKIEEINKELISYKDEELSKINVLKTIYTLVKTVHKYRIQ